MTDPEAVKLAESLIAANDRAYVMPGALLLSTALLAAQARIEAMQRVVEAAREWRAWDVKTKKDGELLEERLAETVDALAAQGGGR